MKSVGELMFTIDVSGSIRLRNLTNPARDIKPVAERIVDMLDHVGASEVWHEQDIVRFKRGLFSRGGWSGSWNILVPFDSGSLRIETEDTALRVRYRFSTVRMMLIITGMMAVLFALGLQHKINHPTDWQVTLKFAGIGWLWLFGMNYLIGMIRVPLWLKRGLRNAAI